MWDGARILPAGFAGMMREPVAASNGDYAKGSLWLRDDNAKPGSEPPLPADTFWLLGHDGQSIAVVPSRRLVVVRLGLTPSRLGYSASSLVASLAARID
jgi:CubicO group peptidase (beta-lactamase class C family)